MFLVCKRCRATPKQTTTTSTDAVFVLLIYHSRAGKLLGTQPSFTTPSRSSRVQNRGPSKFLNLRPQSPKRTCRDQKVAPHFSLYQFALHRISPFTTQAYSLPFFLPLSKPLLRVKHSPLSHAITNNNSPIQTLPKLVSLKSKTKQHFLPSFSFSPFFFSSSRIFFPFPHLESIKRS